MDQVSGRAAAVRAKEVAALQEIRTRQDAVEAFHWVLFRKLRGFEDWWTSRRVVQHMREQNATMRPEVETAAQLYDIARYTPDDKPFTEQELERMRSAIQACATVPSLG